MMSVSAGLFRSTLGLMALLATCSVWAEPPRLVVVIAVDQMRADYLDRFAANYEGGSYYLKGIFSF